MTSRLRCALLPIVVLIAGCGTFGRSPAPSPDKPYVATRLCGFSFDGKTKEVRMTLDLTVQRALPPGATIEVSFENPADAGKPIVVARAVQPKEKDIRIVSTPVTGLKQKTYAIGVRIYPPGGKTAPLASYAESCQSPFASGDIGIDYR